MDAPEKTSLVKAHEEKIVFSEHLSKINDGHYDDHSAEELIKYFSIDDDDIVRLDQSQIIFYDVKCVLNHIIDRILHDEKRQCQINTIKSKRSLELHNDECIFKKRVRFNVPRGEEQASETLFISEAIHSPTQLKPCSKFLYNLGFDLCLKETLDEQKSLTEVQKQQLIKRNARFYNNPVYTCKYCSFKTNTIHVMHYHYRTPHTLNDSNNKYCCTYCSFQTFRLAELRRHFERRHGYVLVNDPPLRRYQCSYCSYESDDKNNYLKHESRCQLIRERRQKVNDLLAPTDSTAKTITKTTVRPNSKLNTPWISTNSSVAVRLDRIEVVNDTDLNEPIIIESDHEESSISLSSSLPIEDEFIVSSDSEMSTAEPEDKDDQDFVIAPPGPKKKRNASSKSTVTKINPSSQNVPVNSTANGNSYSSLSKLLSLNGTPVSSFAPIPIMNSSTSPFIPIQPKPTTNGNNTYQMCKLCQCYICKIDYSKHMKDQHNQTNSTPLATLNNTANTMNIPISSSSTALVLTKTMPQPTPGIFLLSTPMSNSQPIRLDMIKCPWCDTDFEHIDVMTGHLMRYHRMTLAAAKVVVAEQMKIQGTISSELSLKFKKEIEDIQRDFHDKTYWDISRPSVYLHQLERTLCFICQDEVNDIQNHFKTFHQIQIITMYKIKQCFMCGLHFVTKNSSLFEHQLRTHSGICYSSVLRQFIRFDPPPPPIRTRKNNQDRMIAPSPSLPTSSNRRSLSTCTEKKFGCRKCGTSSRLFTFEELVEHLRLHHKLVVKLHRRCLICQESFLKGPQYNQHCLKHLNNAPSIEIKRHYIKK